MAFPDVWARARKHRPQAPRRRSVLALVGLILVGATTLLPSQAQAATATLNLKPGGGASSVVSSSSAAAANDLTFKVPPVASRPVYVGLQLRSASSGSGYRARARVLPSGMVWASVSRVTGGSETLLASKSVGFGVVTGQVLQVEASITGSSPVSVSLRVWKSGSTKPGWQVQYSDTSGNRITSSGSMRAWGYLDAAASKATSVTVTTSSTAASLTSTATGEPTASNTGVPAGTTLTRHDGDIKVTKDGTVLDRMDIHGFVNIRAKNVRITNSIVRGGYANTSATGVITDYGYSGLVIEDTYVQPEHPSVWIDGIKGSDFIARRVHVVGGVDSVKIHGDNVQVLNSLLENTTYFASDPSQNGGATHNDNVQILEGANITISNNSIRGATGFAVLGAANLADVPNLNVTGNWLDGGYCTVKMQSMNGHTLTATAKNNKFGPNRTISNCPFVAETDVNLTASGNVYESNGSAITILRKN